MTTLGDVIHHPALYLAYPQIKETPVRMVSGSRLTDGRVAARGADGAVEIAIDAPNEKLRIALLGVMQELVNSIEGFS